MFRHKWIMVFILLALVLWAGGALSEELYQATIIIANKTVHYSGAEVISDNATVEGQAGLPAPTGELTYVYYTDSACTQPLSGRPKNAGNYYVRAFLASDGVYAAAQSNTALLTILKKTLTDFEYSIDPKGKIYDGNTSYNDPDLHIMFSPSHGLAGDDCLYSGVDVKVSAEFANASAGTHDVLITAILQDTPTGRNYQFPDGSRHTKPCSIQVPIHPATPAITLSDKTAAYNGSAIEIGSAVVKGISGTDVPTGAVTYAYYADEACTDELPGAPKNAGTYYAKAFIAAHCNYTAAESNVARLTIEKKVLTGFGYDISLLGKVYDGNTAYNGLKYISPEGLIAGESLAFGTDVLGAAEYESAAAGKHNVWITATLQDTPAARNYSFEDGSQLSIKAGALIEIRPAAPIIILSGRTAAYTGTAQAIGSAVVQGVSDADVPTGAVTYAYYNDEACTDELPGAPTNAGIYYAKAFIAADGNYTTAESSAARLVITPAVPTLTLESKTATYSGSPVTISPAAVQGVGDTDVPTGAVTYAYYSDEACTDELPGAPTNAGIYYAKAFIAAHGNYTAAQSSAARLVITPAVPTITLTDRRAVYTGSAIAIHPAKVQGVTPEDMPQGAITYQYFADSGLKKATGTPWAPGVYYAVASIAASGNYAGAASEPAMLTIAKPDRPVQQVAAPTGDTITLIHDADTALNMNWQPYHGLVLDQKEEPAFFIASISALDDNALALLLQLLPDCDEDGNAILDAAGQPVYGRRTLNLSAKFIRQLVSKGIRVLNASYGQASISIRLEELTGLTGFENADAFRIVIEPGVADAQEEEAGTLAARDASGVLYRVSVLAVENGGKQETAVQLPEGALFLKAGEE